MEKRVSGKTREKWKVKTGDRKIANEEKREKLREYTDRGTKVYTIEHECCSFVGLTLKRKREREREEEEEIHR